MFKRVNIFTGYTPALIGIASVVCTIVATCIYFTGQIASDRLTRELTAMIGSIIIVGYILVGLPYVFYIVGLGSPKHKVHKILFLIGFIASLLFYIPASIAPIFSLSMITERNMPATIFASLSLITYVLSIIWFLMTTFTLSLFLSNKSSKNKNIGKKG